MFEYKIIDSAGKEGNPNSEFELNELSEQGWDLITIRQACFYFRRRLSVEQDNTMDAEKCACPYSECACKYRDNAGMCNC